MAGGEIFNKTNARVAIAVCSGGRCIQSQGIEIVFLVRASAADGIEV
jgi:hypothetical protein